MTGELFYDLRSWTANQLASGLPLMIDGVDCSLENVRSLERQVKRLNGIGTDR